MGSRCLLLPHHLDLITWRIYWRIADLCNVWLMQLFYPDDAITILLVEDRTPLPDCRRFYSGGSAGSDHALKDCRLH